MLLQLKMGFNSLSKQKRTLWLYLHHLATLLMVNVDRGVVNIVLQGDTANEVVRPGTSLKYIANKVSTLRFLTNF